MSSTLGVLAFSFCAEARHLSKEQRQAVRQLVAQLHDWVAAGVAASEGQKHPPWHKNSTVLGSVIGLNRLFFLLDEPVGEDALGFFAPMMCELAIARYVLPELKNSLAHKLIYLLLKEKTPELLVDGVLETLWFLQRQGYPLPQLPRTCLRGLSSAQIQRVFYLQEKRPDMVEVLRSIGLGFDQKLAFFLPRERGTDRAPRGFCAGQQSIPAAPVELPRGAQLQAYLFLKVLKDALSKRTVERLDKEKEQEITNTALFYERLALLDHAAGKVSLEMLQHCSAWVQSGDFKKAAQQYLEKRHSALPLFGAVYLAQALVEGESGQSSPEALLGAVQWYLPAAGEAILDSLLFYLSQQHCPAAKARSCAVVGQVISWQLAPGRFTEFERLHLKYRWVFSLPGLVQSYLVTAGHQAECRAFLVGELLKHKQLQALAALSLEEEALAQVGEYLKKFANDPDLIAMQSYLEEKCGATRARAVPGSEDVGAQLVPGEKEVVHYIESFQKRQAQENPRLKELFQTILEMGVGKESLGTLKGQFFKIPPPLRLPSFLVLVHFVLLLETDAASLAALIASLEPLVESGG